MRAAVLCATRNLYPDLAPPIKALLLHSDVERIYILAEDPDVGVWLPPVCRVMDVSGQDIFDRRGPNYTNPWAWIVLMRAAFYRIFPELDRILSLDLDAFCLADVSGLWRLDLTGKLLAGVRETTYLSTPQFPYYNAGVLMQNLELLRSSGAGDQIVRALQRRRFPYPEQDAFNLICSGAVLELPPEYNAGRGTAPWEDPPKIRHYMGEQKTYRFTDIARHYRELPWEAILQDKEEKW